MAGGSGVLHMFCGKIASGKSTLARRLAGAPRTVLLSEDYLLSRLYPDEIATLEDYVRRTMRLRSAIGPHVQDLLCEGLDVVLDFQVNTPSLRSWMRALFESAGADHRLHCLEAPDSLCKARLKERNASGKHQYRVSEAEFDHFTARFIPPAQEEGFKLVLHEQRSPVPYPLLPLARPGVFFRRRP